MTARLLFLAAVAVIAAPAAAAATPSRPDLRIRFLVDPPSELPAGQSFSTAVQVQNTGRATSASARTSLYLTKDPQKRREDIPLDSLSSPHLAAGHMSLKGIRLRVPGTTPAAEYFLVACADAEHQVRESDERHNCVTSAESVQIIPSG